MDLKVKDIAELLNVSEAEIEQWIQEKKIPAYRLHHQYRFGQIEIENWMMGCRFKRGEKQCLNREGKSIARVDGEAEKQRAKGMYQFSLYRAIHSGRVLTSIQGTTKEAVIRETMEEVADALSVDTTLTTELLLDRERFQPTTFNRGVAVPHVRDFLIKGPKNVVVVVFLKEPVNWGALDGYPVHTLFFLFASNDRHHLHLLAKLAYLGQSEEALALIQSRPDKKKMLEYIRKWEGE